MRHLIRYLRPYVLLVLLAVGLLFVQANAELALPDYMSRIVNVGIQQGGVESPVPEAMRASTLERLADAATAVPADQGPAPLLRSSYRLIEPGTPAAGEYVDRYPALASEPVYVFTGSEADRAALAPVVAQAFLAASGTGPMAQAMEPPLQRQAATRMVKAEYEALGIDAVQIQTRYVLRTGGVMLLLSLLSATATILVGFLAARTAAGFARDLRLGIFSRVESFSGQEFDTFSTASLITRTTNDVMQIEMVVVMLIRMVFYAPIIGIGGIIRAMSKGSSMWWVIALAVGVLLTLVFVVYKVAVPKFKLMQKLTDRLNLVSRESLSGMMVIRAFNREAHEEHRFDSANTELTATTLFVNRVMVVLMPVMMLIMNGLSVLIIWVGAEQVAAANMQVGDLMAFLQYTMQIVFAFLMLSFMFIMLPRAAVSADRVAEVLKTEPSITDPESPAQFAPRASGGGVVEFRDVSFRYPGADQDALHNITFTARPGTTTAVIGATGSGKSTIAGLIPRFYDVTGGRILVDGVDVREVTQHDLRARIGYVPQKALLFSGTIGSNLRYADEQAGEEELQAAAATAQAQEFIKQREDGVEAAISQGGINVSGGQKQRLSIARALVGRPPVLIFDDSFSALDFRTESAVRRELKEHTAASTVIMVSQRVATVKSADQIIVLDQGRVAGIGAHWELLSTCETYREIAESQLTAEELA